MRKERQKKEQMEIILESTIIEGTESEQILLKNLAPCVRKARTPLRKRTQQKANLV
jgi:hypothetical protein